MGAAGLKSFINSRLCLDRCFLGKLAHKSQSIHSEPSNREDTMNRFILLIIISAITTACGDPSEFKAESSIEQTGIRVSRALGQICLAPSKWVCHNPNSELHGSECTAACTEAGDSNTFCWELTADDCSDQEYDWAESYCPILEQDCGGDADQVDGSLESPLAGVSRRFINRTVRDYGQPAPNVFNDFQEAADGAAEDEDSAHEVEEEADEGTELEPRRTQGNGGGQAVFCPPDEPDCCDDLPAGIECYQA